ncbi:hypothetical protein [Herbaspirillum sp. alder98]|uniref:hypothetical protein n=1 Tax=Herbaspirillum sp. alder98 TaxID=2913096 RepID=UPI001CD8768E|nr:hypothetical protein [Herbaspirillum sp. alder98]MCA1324080.1 hypothetical protein [Herbaspirillum sp. alder98]
MSSISRLQVGDKKMKIQIRPHAIGEGWSLILDDFEPSGGYAEFQKKLCIFLGEKFDYWHQGVAEGVGRMSYQQSFINTYWADYPFTFCLECPNENTAHRLRADCERYLRLVC